MKAAPTLLSIAILAACCNCSTGNGGTASNGTSGTGGTATGGTAGGGGYTEIMLDRDAGLTVQFEVAVGPNDQIGVAYFEPAPGAVLGQPNAAIKYTEVKNGAVTVPAEEIKQVQIQDGITVAFEPNGTPAVGFLGGDAGILGDAGATASVYWLQSQAEIDERVSAGVWTPSVCMANTTQNGQLIWTGVDTSANAFVNFKQGFVVGLWPSLVFDGGTAIMAFRDVHEGQFPIQDYGSSDAKMCIGGPTDWSWSAPMTVAFDGNHKYSGLGLHNQLIFGQGGSLVLIGDSDSKDQGAPAAGGTGPVNLTMQQSAVLYDPASQDDYGDWSPPLDPFNPTGPATPTATVNATESGPRIAYSDATGYVAVVTDTAPVGNGGTQAPALYYTTCTGTQACCSGPPSTCAGYWSTPTTVYQLGSGGFYPDVAVDPTSGTAFISFIICSLAGNANPTPGFCTTDAALQVATVTGGIPPITTVKKGAFYDPKLKILSNGKQVFVYSDMTNGGLRMLIQN